MLRLAKLLLDGCDLLRNRNKCFLSPRRALTKRKQRLANKRLQTSCHDVGSPFIVSFNTETWDHWTISTVAARTQRFSSLPLPVRGVLWVCYLPGTCVDTNFDPTCFIHIKFRSNELASKPASTSGSFNVSESTR